MDTKVNKARAHLTKATGTWTVFWYWGPWDTGRLETASFAEAWRYLWEMHDASVSGLKRLAAL